MAASYIQNAQYPSVKDDNANGFEAITFVLILYVISNALIINEWFLTKANKLIAIVI